MKKDKKLQILKSRNRKKFFSKIFCVWTEKKTQYPDKLICFWCEKMMEPKEYFNNWHWFVSTFGGEIFESPTKGHKHFNKLYQNTFNVELCRRCYYNLDVYNKTGLVASDFSE